MTIQRRHYIPWLLVLTALTALSHEAFALSDEELAWNKAVVVIDRPQDRFIMSAPETQAALAKITEPRPIYAFFHGSGGINPKEIQAIANVMVRSGWIVIAPDSPSESGFMKDHVKTNHRYRLKEIDYAMKQVQAAPWADKSRIVFAGQSAGAIALADYEGAAPLTAMVLSGFNCQWLQQKIDAPLTVPVLSIQDPRDPTFGIEKGLQATYGTCKEELAKSGRAKSYVKEMPNVGHKVLLNVEGRRAMREFVTNLGLMRQDEIKAAVARARAANDKALGIDDEMD